MRSYKYSEKWPLDPNFLAYACGMIASDGNIKSDRTCLVRLTLQASEGDYIINFAKKLIIGDKLPIYCRENSKGFEASLPSFHAFLLSIGITSRKSLNIDVDFSKFTEEQRLYFLRGEIDGDGTINLWNTKGQADNKINIVSASEKFATSLAKFFGGNLVVVRGELRNYFHVNWTGQKARDLAKLLPKDDFCLERKTEVLEKLSNLSNIKLHQRNPELNISQIVKNLPYKLKYRTVQQRLAKRLSLEAATQPDFYSKVSHRKEYSFNHIQYSLSNLCEYFNLNYSGFYARFQRNFKDILVTLSTYDISPKQFTMFLKEV